MQEGALGQVTEASEEALRLIRDIQNIPFQRIFLVLLGAWLLVRLIQWLVPRLSERLPSRIRLILLPTVPLLRVAIMVAAFWQVMSWVLVWSYQNLVAIAGAAGVAVGFAFKDYVSSVSAGIINLYERTLRPGDWVQIDDQYGEVQSLGLRSIKLLTPDDTVVSVPNIKLWTANILNSNDGATTHMCVADFYLHPGHDALQVRRRLMDVLLSSPYLHLDRRITIVAAEKPWGTHYKVKGYPIDGRTQFLFTTDLTIRAKQALTQQGVRFATPPVSTVP